MRNDETTALVQLLNSDFLVVNMVMITTMRMRMKKINSQNRELCFFWIELIKYEQTLKLVCFSSQFLVL